MPGLDGTGPQGQGPLTGRAMGKCGSGQAKPSGRGMGRGMGAGQGTGRGFGRGFAGGYVEPVNLSKEEQKKILKAQLKNLDE